MSILLVFSNCWHSFSSSSSTYLQMTLDMYNSISRLMGETQYPELWWEERVECYDNLSPDLAGTMEKAWEGMVEYWSTRGKSNDTWRSCSEKSSWFEWNFTTQPGVTMDIWEPCNYASNLAYDRSVANRDLRLFQKCYKTDVYNL